MSQPGCSEERPRRAASIRHRSAVALGRLAGDATRRLGRGGGTALPGLLASTLAPRLIERLPDELACGVAVVTGTNGKTTTAHLLATAARAAGLDPLTNRSGSNLERGLVSTYVEAAKDGGALPQSARAIGVLEVDEAALPALLPRLQPRVVVFLNLFRDQLDRYGEVASVAEGWTAMLQAAGAAGERPTVVLNGDDPSIEALAEAAPGRVVRFGVDDGRVALAAADHASDARLCVCGSTYVYEATYMGHVGVWSCRSCERRRREPDVVARHVRLGLDGTRFELSAPGVEQALTMPLAGLHSVYNVLAAAAAAYALELPLGAASAALGEAGPAFGRQERLRVGDGPREREVRMWLAKNPTGLNEVLRTLTTGPPRPSLHLLMLLNDGVQDGEDVSWIYDADLELLGGRVVGLTASGDRADDLALRLALAGTPPERVDSDPAAALSSALAEVPEGGRLEVVATYTAMLELRRVLEGMAGAAPYWEQPRSMPGRARQEAHDEVAG